MTATTASHHVVGVSFSPEELERRRHTLGGSEVPAVLGLDRYRGPHDVWLQKRGIAPAFEGNEYTEWGLRMEPAIRQKVADVLGVTIEQRGTVIHPENLWMSATPDGEFLLEGVRTVLEMKNKTDRQAVYWGVAGTDQVPFDVAAQTHWQMEVAGAERAVVAVLFGKADFRLYHLFRDPEIITPVIAQCFEFWEQNVVRGIEPEISGSKATAEYLKKKFAENGDALRAATAAEEALIKQLRTIREQMKVLEGSEDALKNKLMAAIASDAGLQGRAGRITWKRPNGAQVGWKDVALALKAPQSLIDQFSTPMARKFVPYFPKED